MFKVIVFKYICIVITPSLVPVVSKTLHEHVSEITQNMISHDQRLTTLLDLVGNFVGFTLKEEFLKRMCQR